MRKKILIVDDEESFGDIVKLNLEHTGVYEVRVENRGKKAVSAAEEFKPDLIILDVMMPDRDGLAVLEDLRRREEFKETPVIFLTAFLSKQDYEKITKKTPLRPLIATKPISSDELLRLVEKHLGP